VKPLHRGPHLDVEPRAAQPRVEAARPRVEARHGVVPYVQGDVDRSDVVFHVVVNRLESLDQRARALASVSRDYH